MRKMMKKKMLMVMTTMMMEMKTRSQLEDPITWEKTSLGPSYILLL